MGEGGHLLTGLPQEKEKGNVGLAEEARVRGGDDELRAEIGEISSACWGGIRA